MLEQLEIRNEGETRVLFSIGCCPSEWVVLCELGGDWHSSLLLFVSLHDASLICALDVLPLLLRKIMT